METEFGYPWDGVMVKILYLDYNCFQRSFDDQRQARIRMETAACEEIFETAAQSKIRLAWSFMHEDENALCPFVDRKIEVLKLSEICKVRILPSDAIRSLALALQKECKLKSKDALHVACAKDSGASHFVTCDDALQKRAGDRIGNMVIIGPTEYVMGAR